MLKRDPPWISVLLAAAILLAGTVLRVVYLNEDRFHADEALYAGWALNILDGDTFLLNAPVDKPPLYLTLLATSMRVWGERELAARLPNLAASILGMALLYRLAARLYDPRTARWTALLAACSPYDILFARTAFTDPLLVTWTLAALCAIGAGHWFWAGLLAGLAFATKQHAIVLIPLILAVGWVQAARAASARPRGQRLRGYAAMHLSGLLGWAIPLALVTWWDAQRWTIRPGYWRQSAMSYGGLTWAAPDRWGERLLEWLSWARYLVGSPLLYAMLLLGACALVAVGWRRRPAARQTWLDTIWTGYGTVYVLAHTVLLFSIWDRYLLPLAPLASLLLARVVVTGSDALHSLSRDAHVANGSSTRHRLADVRPGLPMAALRPVATGLAAATSLAVAVCLAAVASGGKAALNGYPVGGEHWAYQGLDQVTAYLVAHAPHDAVLYHHWLRWHYTFYLHDTGFELRWWESSEHLRREATRTPDRAQYIVLPDWRTLEPDADGLLFEPVYKTYRRDGSVSLQVYRIRIVSQADAGVPEAPGSAYEMPAWPGGHRHGA